MFFTVLAPIVLYTDRLGSFKTSFSKNEFIEEVSTFAFGGDTRQLNLLPQESSTILKEPIGIVYSDSSVLNSDVSTGDSSSTFRESADDSQLRDSVEHKSRVLYTTTDGDQSQRENLIRQVTDELHEVNHSSVLRKPDSTGNQENRKPRRDAKKEAQPRFSGQISNDVPENMEMKPEQQSARTAGKVDTKESIRTKIEKQNDPTVMPDSRVRHLKDQLIRARVYLSLSATRNNPHFIRELRLRMKEVQRALGDATKDSDLPRNAYEKLKAMEQTLAKGKQIQDDCAAVVKKLRAILHSTEEQLRVHKKQTMFLTQLNAKTLPKGLHCLPLRLSTEYYTLNFSQQHFPNQDKLEDPRLYHYALFSDNILAAAVVVNSTVSRAKVPASHVFHIVTDRLNYAAMRMWFLSNPPGKATIQVQNIEEFTWLNSSYSPVLKQLGSPSMIDFYFKAHRSNSDSNLKFRNPKYLSILNHLRFYLPGDLPKAQQSAIFR
ncbi:hypothetical protein L1049_010165 [Liquidambar formosana]|uniref:Hexosyltransferase n=1 Tax=Liquidambar formosana TaxID=63359 RepID=A0AAP0R1K8_LIQFO